MKTYPNNKKVIELVSRWTGENVESARIFWQTEVEDFHSGNTLTNANVYFSDGRVANVLIQYLGPTPTVYGQNFHVDGPETRKRKAAEFIALNDCPGDPTTEEELSGWLSVVTAAELLGIQAEEMARAVFAARESEGFNRA